MRHNWIALLLLAASVATTSASAEEDWEAVAAAAAQAGPVLAYTTLSPDNWAPILEGFNAKYPDIEVQTVRTGSHAETFERYRAESASATTTADVVLAVGPDQWEELVASGDVTPFDVENKAALPEFSYTDTGRYTLSTDSQVIIYNKLVLPEDLWPTGTADLVEKVEANPDAFAGKIGSYNPMVSPFSYSVYWTLKEHLGEDAFWTNEAVLAPNLKFEQTAGAMTNKVLTGEYVVGYMLPEALVPPVDDSNRDILGVIYADDGTPVLLREMALMSKGSNPDGGKLLINFLTSEEGQVVLSDAGLTPYLPGIEGDVSRHYANVVAGSENADRVALYEWNENVGSQMEDFRTRFQDLAGE